MTAPDFDEIRDITIIGAGPVGLSTAFWAGMREASSRIIDSLPELGGQLTTLYPGEVDLRRARPPADPRQGPRRRAARAGARPVRRAGAPRDDRARDRLRGRPRRAQDRPGDLRSRTVIVAGGHGAFEPKKLPLSDVDMTPVGGPRRALPGGREAGLRGQARGDRRRRRLRLRLGRATCSTPPRRSRSCTAARASAPTRRPSRRSWATSTRAASTSRCPTSSRASRATARSRPSSCTTPAARASSAWAATRCCSSSASRPSSARSRSGASRSRRARSCVDGLMKTSLDRVWACGDITTFDGKLKLIATGFAEAAIAVSQAVHAIRPGHADPAGLLDQHAACPASSRARSERRAPAPGRSGPRGADRRLRRPAARGAGLARPARGPLRRARAHDRGPAAVGARGARDLAPADSRASTAARRRRRRSSPTTPTSCASRRASRAPRSPTCARSPSTCSPASSSSTASRSCPTRR